MKRHWFQCRLGLVNRLSKIQHLKLTMTTVIIMANVVEVLDFSSSFCLLIFNKLLAKSNDKQRNWGAK